MTISEFKFILFTFLIVRVLTALTKKETFSEFLAKVIIGFLLCGILFVILIGICTIFKL